MANLKLDLINKIKNDKYYDELELVRLASDPNTNYAGKVDSMSILLSKIAIQNAKLQLIEVYFQEPVEGQPTAEGQPVGQPVAQGQPAHAHPGQTHAE